MQCQERESKDEAVSKILVNATHGKEDPERVTLAFVFANVAAPADQEVVVLLTIEVVWLETKGYADEIHEDGFPLLAEVPQEFVASGGQIWACRACANPRGITAAANAIGFLIGGAAAMAF